VYVLITCVALASAEAGAASSMDQARGLRGRLAIVSPEALPLRKSLRGLAANLTLASSNQTVKKSLRGLAATSAPAYSDRAAKNSLRGLAAPSASATLEQTLTKRLRGVAVLAAPASVTLAQPLKKSLRGLVPLAVVPRNQTAWKRLRGRAQEVEAVVADAVVADAVVADAVVAHSQEVVTVVADAKSVPDVVVKDIAKDISAQVTSSGNIVFSGRMRIDVPDPRSFLTDAVAQQAATDGIANIIGIRPEFFAAEASWAGSMFMLDSDEIDRHIDRSVDMDYTITLPPHHVMSPISFIYMFNSQSNEEVTSAVQEALTAVKGPHYSIEILDHEMVWP